VQALHIRLDRIRSDRHKLQSPSVIAIQQRPIAASTVANWTAPFGEYIWGRRSQRNRSLRDKTLKANSHIPCRAHAVPLPCRAAKGLDCVLPIWFTQCVRVWFTHAMSRPCHATIMPFWKRLLKVTAQRGVGMAWHVWISIGRPETACGRPACVRLLPATTRSSTKVVIRSIPIR
jgi:hypothetical protein